MLLVDIAFTALMSIVFIFVTYKVYGHIIEEEDGCVVSTIMLLGCFLGGSISLMLTTQNTILYFKGERSSEYLEVLDQESKRSIRGKITVTNRYLTFYKKGILLKCNVSNTTYEEAKSGKKVFYVGYFRDKDTYFCESVE